MGSFWVSRATPPKDCASKRHQRLLKRHCGLSGGPGGGIGQPIGIGGSISHDCRMMGVLALRSACQHWRFANEAFIADLLNKKVRHVGARDEPKAPVARIELRGKWRENRCLR